MQATQSALVKLGQVAIVVALVWVARYYWLQQTVSEPDRDIKLSQKWSLQPGDEIADYQVMGGLGDISIQVKGQSVYAPFAGRLQPNRQSGCALYSTDNVPAYLFRLCGLKHPKYGLVKAGEVIGKSQILQFATLRRQPDGTWAFVETSRDILEKTLKKP